MSPLQLLCMYPKQTVGTTPDKLDLSKSTYHTCYVDMLDITSPLAHVAISPQVLQTLITDSDDPSHVY